MSEDERPTPELTPASPSSSDAAPSQVGVTRAEGVSDGAEAPSVDGEPGSAKMSEPRRRATQSRPKRQRPPQKKRRPAADASATGGMLSETVPEGEDPAAREGAVSATDARQQPRRPRDRGSEAAVASGADATAPAAGSAPVLEPVSSESGEAPRAEGVAALREQDASRVAAASAPVRQPRSSARPSSGKLVAEMSLEELVAQFSRRGRGRPSKKELRVREVLAAAQENPTAEMLDRARAVVAETLGTARSSRRAQPVAAAPEASVRRTAPETLPSGESAAKSDASQAAQTADRVGAEAACEPAVPETGYGSRRRRHERRGADATSERSQQDGSWQKGQQGQRDQQRRDRDGSAQPRQQRDGRFGQQGQQQGQNGSQRQRDARQAQGGFSSSASGQYAKNGRRNGRNGQQRDVVVEPKANREELEELKVGELRSKAQELGIDPAGLKKPELIDAVYAALVKQEGFFEVKGILDLTNEGYGFVRTKGYLASENDAYISAGVVRSNGLRRGDEVCGIAHLGRPNDKFPAVNKVMLVNGKAPDELRGRPRFGDLTPVFPCEPLKMEHGRDSILGRCIDLVAPIGKGQRGLIVSPPKAGKTTVLKKIAESIAANNPEVHLICLLVDERPEEVTDMQRSIRGEVVASTFDMPCDNHITVSELVIERAKRLVEQGDDVVILLDSITRLARAYNLAQPASGRILSGGVDSTALYPPKRFLGAARNIENGGSLTILASALVDTGSKMDEVIFEEFKGTGNMELKLDRDLADRRIFPAIDPISSGTRKEELLLDPSIAPFVWGIRRILAGMNSNERAMSSLIKSLKATANNEEFLVRSAKKAQMQEMGGDL